MAGLCPGAGIWRSGWADRVHAAERGLGGRHDFRGERIGRTVPVQDPLEVVPGHFVPVAAAVASERHPGLERHGRAPLAEQGGRDVVAGFGQDVALRDQQDGAGRGVERRPVAIVAGHVVLEAAGAAERLQAEVAGRGPEVLGEAERAGPPDIVRGEGAGEAGQERGLELGMVRDRQLGLEVADRRLQVDVGLGEPGLPLRVGVRAVMPGGAGAGMARGGSTGLVKSVSSASYCPVAGSMRAPTAASSATVSVSGSVPVVSTPMASA